MKYFAVALLMILSTLSLNAQKGFSVEISFGPSASNFLNNKAPHSAPEQYWMLSTQPNPLPLPEHALAADARAGFTAGVALEKKWGNGMSVRTGLYYENKGMNYNHSLSWDTLYVVPELNYSSRRWGSKHNVKKIQNDYISIPMVFRQYLLKNRRLFVEMGGYAAWLLQSRYDNKTEFIAQRSDLEGESYSGYIAFKDEKKEFTHHWDFGLSAGIGYQQPIANKWYISGAVETELGLSKVDAKYHNQYEEQVVPGPNGYITYVQSSNYYGLNSYSKNIFLTLRFGVGYRF